MIIVLRAKMKNVKIAKNAHSAKIVKHAKNVDIVLNVINVKIVKVVKIAKNVLKDGAGNKFDTSDEDDYTYISVTLDRIYELNQKYYLMIILLLFWSLKNEYKKSFK